MYQLTDDHADDYACGATLALLAIFAIYQANTPMMMTVNQLSRAIIFQTVFFLTFIKEADVKVNGSSRHFFFSFWNDLDLFRHIYVYRELLVRCWRFFFYFCIFNASYILFGNGYHHPFNGCFLTG